LREEVAEMKQMVQALLSGQNTEINRQNIELNGSDAYLEQNQPNPFNTQTLIKYHVSENATEAIVNVVDMTGRIIYSERVTVGTGELQIKAGTVAAGAYTYSLIVNGRVLDTKRMVITK